MRDDDRPPGHGAVPDGPVGRVRRVELDHRVLAGAKADLDSTAWGLVLRDAGVTRVPLGDAAPGAAGRAVEDAREARRLVDALESQALAPARPTREQRAAVGLVLGALVLGVVGYPAVGLGLGLAGVGVAVHWLRRADAARLADTATSLQQRRELHARVRALAGRTFVALLGDDTLVINTPHLTFLEARIHDVDRAWGRMLDRDRALARLRQEMVASNRSLGREEVDAEVQAIDDERSRLQVSEPSFKTLRDQLEARLHQAQENVEYLAEVGRRQALSRQLGGVLEHAPGDSLAELAASLEIDIAAVEAELQRLDVSLSDADASLRALLEVEEVARQK